MKQILDLLGEYPPGTEVEVSRDGCTEKTIITEIRITQDAIYLGTLDCGSINAKRIPEVIRRKGNTNNGL